MQLLHFLAMISAFAGLALFSPANAEPPAPLKVVVTLKPIHSLAAAVMEGAGTPHLLIKGASSEHSYSLRPSDARVLYDADIVVRVSGRLESFLEKPLASLGPKIRLVTLINAPGMKLLRPRLSGVFEAHDHQGADADHAHPEQDERPAAPSAWGGGDAEHDLHLWLSPTNAAVIADHLAAVLGEVRPPQAQLFRDNAERLKLRLAELDGRLRAMLEPLKGRDFIVFHDAYQYFEAEYGLHAAGAITLSPERQPGAARLRDIRARIADAHQPCVFSEPQFEPKLVATVIEGTSARAGVLDPLGANLAEGPEQYFQLMEALSASFAKCLR